jgi:hypothetical protein
MQHIQSLEKIRKHLSALQLLIEMHFRKYGECDKDNILTKVFEKVDNMDKLLQKELDLLHYYNTTGNRRKE